MDFNLQEIKDMVYNNSDLSDEEKGSIIKGFIESRISHLKFFLSESDWKVIVNYELVSEGLPIKYPNLHSERQAWRDEINLIEAELENI